MKVLYATSNLGPGGKERQLVETISHIDRNTVYPELIVYSKGAFYSESVKKKNIVLYEIQRGFTKIGPFFRSWSIIRQFRPDIIHAWDTLSMVYTYLPARFFGSRIIDGSIRDAGVDKGIFYYYKRFFLKRADAIISNSSAGLKAYNIGGYVIYNGINQARFLTKSLTGEFTVIMVANFSKYKDHLTFLKASLALLREKVADRIFLVGDGPLKEEYISFVKMDSPGFIKKVIFTGTVRNVEEFLACSNIGVLCSTAEYNEGLSNAVLEYLASGTIPVVTRNGGSPEIIEDGLNGYLVNAGNHEEIVEKIRMLRMDQILQDKLIAEGRKTIKKKFSIDENVKKLGSLYQSLFILD